MATITVSTLAHVPRETAWKIWNDPKHIVRWCSGSADWHTTTAENDPRVGGKFKTTMAAKDGSAGFDFEGTYTVVKSPERIEYTTTDERKVVTLFETDGADGVRITQTFETEDTNTPEKQREGWQTILDNFKAYVESTTEDVADTAQ